MTDRTDLTDRTDRFERDDELTAREHEVLGLLARGMSNRQIAGELYVGVETVRTHVRRILRKLGVANRTQAAVHWIAGDRVPLSR